MKIFELKKRIFEALGVTNTQELKKVHPDLVISLDLRTKKAWQKIEKAICVETELEFQKMLVKAKKNNRLSNQNTNQALEQWDRFKQKTEAEIDGKLTHLSDYNASRRNRHPCLEKQPHAKVIKLKK